MKRALCGIVAAWLMFIGNSSQGAEPKENAKPDAAVVGEIRTQKLKGFTFYYASTRANLENLSAKLKVLIPDLQKSVLDAHAVANGPLVMIYQGVTGDPKADFDLQVGYPIMEKVNGVGDFKVREVGEYSCMSLLFSGPLAQLGSAYGKLMPAVMGGPAKPSGESREMYLYFEGIDSPNNVVHISAGTK
jgi:hypothetical protein